MASRIETNKTSNSPFIEQTRSGQIIVAEYGLRGETLSPMEALAQSVSTIAPTSTPANCPTGLGAVNKTIGALRQIQMSLGLTF